MNLLQFNTVCIIFAITAFCAHAETGVISQQELINWSSEQHFESQTIYPLQQSPIIIDVRKQAEFKKGHIPKAINIPYELISSNPKILDQFKDQDLVLYCWSGEKAENVLAELDSLGYPALYHLNGDMKGWLSQGRDVAF